ncbi:hypothetical protein APA_5185 [Pseudanabaena sp. lw0831]|nr:hypothetical protein APA_5185 [Pseudanabaena sp. lw0831]
MDLPNVLGLLTFLIAMILAFIPILESVFALSRIKNQTQQGF